jgi:hypothetical protein
LLPLALRGVDHRGDRFLAIGMIPRDVGEHASRTGHAVPELVGEERARRAILERRYGIVVGRTGELGAALGEASDVLVQALPRLLLAVAQLQLLAEAGVCALEIPDQDST